MSSSSTPLIYAELLSNIRRVSVIASFPTPATKSTKVQLLSSPDRQQLELFHDGATTLLTLPARVASTSALQQPATASREMSWSIPMADQAPSNATFYLTDSIAAPWAASNLHPGTEILCRNCKAAIVVAGTIQSWRDLPSENWAEMMDFWHCHKPSEHKENGDHQADANLSKKGYGANNRFMAQSGVGFVDLTYFLLSEKDCAVLEIDLPESSQPESHQDSTPPTTLTCANPTCNSALGILDPPSSGARGCRLWKWTLDLPTARPAMPPLSQFFTAQLLSLASAQAVRKFVLRPSTPDAITPILHLWLFAPNLTVSFSPSTSSTALIPSPTPAIKLLYQHLTIPAMEALLTTSTSVLPSAQHAVEEVALPAAVVEEINTLLVASSVALPERARRFGKDGEWNVGLLERFIDTV